jgi:hypothetical protein
LKGTQMKRIIVLTLVVLMLAVSAVTAFAKGPSPANQGANAGNCGGNQTGMGVQAGFSVQAPYALSGTISALSVEARTVTVTVACGNRLAQPSIGLDVTLQTTDATRFLLRSTDGTVTPITFADLAVGQKISSHGTLVEGVWTAVRVTSGALLYCQP